MMYKIIKGYALFVVLKNGASFPCGGYKTEKGVLEAIQAYMKSADEKDASSFIDHFETQSVYKVDKEEE